MVWKNRTKEREKIGCFLSYHQKDELGVFRGSTTCKYSELLIISWFFTLLNVMVLVVFNFCIKKIFS
jgi:hypothetical protein